MQRGCAAALLTEGETTLINPGRSNDDLAAIDTIQKLGAEVKVTARATCLLFLKGSIQKIIP
jgi:3-phosphoshikimate 1-carboxyvinyltransferase